MSETLVRVTIDGREVSVPKGMLIVDAAKKLGIDIPVFCYHPKMKPVGMCRMCLVEVGRPQRDRATGQVIRNERGQPVMQFAGKLETACTTPVEDGWEIRVDSPGIGFAHATASADRTNVASRAAAPPTAAK